MELKKIKDKLVCVTEPQHLLTIGVIAGFFFSIGFFGLINTLKYGEPYTIYTQISIVFSFLFYIGCLLLFDKKKEKRFD